MMLKTGENETPVKAGKENAQKRAKKKAENRKTVRLKYSAAAFADLFAILLLFSGLVLFPMHLRCALLSEKCGYLARVNVLFLAGVLLLLLIKTGCTLWMLSGQSGLKTPDIAWTRADLVMVILWQFCAGLMFYSNYGTGTAKGLSVFCVLLVPSALLLCQIRKEHFRLFMNVFLALFDLFIFFLLAVAIAEKVSGNEIMTALNEQVNSSEYLSYLKFMQREDRFCSVWGHALTNAVLFNGFFIINDLYCHTQRKYCPKLIFFVIALMGDLLCGGKVSLAALAVYMIASCIANFRQDWKILAGGAAAAVAALLSGKFDTMIARFLGSSLTSGRFRALKIYLKKKIYPLRILIGYGTGTTYKGEMTSVKAAFDCPALMYALDYGIVYSALMLGGIFVYISAKILSRRQWLCWIGFAALFVQANCYNGMSLANQDCFAWVCLFLFLILNCAVNSLRETDEKKVKGGGDRGWKKKETKKETMPCCRRTGRKKNPRRRPKGRNGWRKSRWERNSIWKNPRKRRERYPRRGL